MQPEAELSFQDALDVIRPLDESNPAAYRADMAVTMFNLAQTYLHEDKLPKAESEVSEAVGIFSEIWKINPVAYANQFAISQLLYAEILQSTGADPAKMCTLLQRAYEVANEPDLKQQATTKSAGCKPQ
jgi:hypothetical protein